MRNLASYKVMLKNKELQIKTYIETRTCLSITISLTVDFKYLRDRI